MNRSTVALHHDFAGMSNDELAAALTTLAAHIHAATYRFLTLIADLYGTMGSVMCEG